jgi:hypothetical protein
MLVLAITMVLLRVISVIAFVHFCKESKVSWYAGDRSAIAIADRIDSL